MYASVTAFHFLSADLQQVWALSPWPTGYLCFIKASLGSDHLFFFFFFFFCWFGGDVETGAPLFSAEWSINMTNHEFKDSHCKRFLSVPKSQQGNSSPLSPANTQGLDSRRPCTRLLRSCGICRLPFELFARVFLRPKCVCQAQHMIIVHQ